MNDEYSDLRRDFWTNTNWWPLNSSDHYFLGYVVQMFGRALFGDQWTGDEFATPWIRSLPNLDDPNLTIDDIVHAQRALFEVSAEYRFRTTNPALLPLPTRDEWEQLQALLEFELQRVGPAITRCHAVMWYLRELFESGAIPTGARRLEGGEIFHLDRSLWNGESVVRRFVTCRIHPSDPFSWTPAVEDGLHLFAAQEPVNRYLGLLRPSLDAPDPAPDRPPQDQHSSIYLRFMVDQARELGLGGLLEPKHEELASHLAAAWRNRHPEVSLSTRLLKSMATLMRSPAAQGGRNRRREAG